jgi:putative FmdB family regulatory protein
MPIYEYECLQCGKRTELLQRMNDAPLATCPQCGGAVRKLISAPAVQFKGSGWYVTDYAGKKGASSGKSESKSESSSSEGKSESKSEAKSESKGEGKSESKSPSSDSKPSSGSSD